jgi:hypothetical protein
MHSGDDEGLSWLRSRIEQLIELRTTEGLNLRLAEEYTRLAAEETELLRRRRSLAS